jgi:hypothetical protein
MRVAAVDTQAVDTQVVDTQVVDMQVVDTQVVDTQVVDMQSAYMQAVDTPVAVMSPDTAAVTAPDRFITAAATTIAQATAFPSSAV